MIDASAIALPNILFIDLKTSGIYLKGEPIDSPQQPWSPYIAAMHCNSAGQVINHFSAYIQPDGRKVMQAAKNQHGIDDKAAARLGIPEARAIGLLSDMLKICQFQKVVTFGDMNKMLIGTLLARFAVFQKKPSDTYARLWLARQSTTFVDVQKPTAQQICKLPSEFDDGDYKWPSFAEAAKVIVGREPSELRDSLEDLLILKDMYFNLKHRGFFVEPGETP